MKHIKLSYVITTYNKLVYLKEVIRLLLSNIKSNEEIIIVDAASSDGTPQYLSSLLKKGKIHQFISECDKGEGHGYNKALLIAKGELIKIITDDDVYDYKAISECKSFMLKNKQYDLMVGYAATVRLEKKSNIKPIEEFYEEFLKWKTGINDRFYGNGLSIMIRKNSLPLLGIFNNDQIYIDVEYILRVSKNANIAFSNKCIGVRIANPYSKSRVLEGGKNEFYSLCRFYNYPTPKTWLPVPVPKTGFLMKIRVFMSSIKKKALSQKPFVPNRNSSNEVVEEVVDLNRIFIYYEKELSRYNSLIETSFDGNLLDVS